MEELLKERPRLRLLSKAKVLKAAADAGVSRREAAEWYDRQELGELYRRKKAKSDFRITAPPYSFQIDVIVLKDYATANRGVTNFFFAVDILSRKAFAYPLPSGKMDDVLDAFEKFYNDAEYPINSVAGDDFFNHKDFREVVEALGAKLYTDVAKDDHITAQGDKLGIINRATRTIKRMINKEVKKTGSMRWTRFLPGIIEEYNNASHASLKGDAPNEVYDDRDYMEAMHAAGRAHNRAVKLEFKPGDRVRVQREKGTFEKEGATYSTKVYTVEERVGNSFRLAGLRRLYRDSEMIKAKATEGRVRDGAQEAARANRRVTRATARALDVPEAEAEEARKTYMKPGVQTRSRAAAEGIVTRSRARRK